MHHIALHHYSKFQTKFLIFPRFKPKKPVRSSLKWYFLLLSFQISKLQNYMSHVNETWSRYVPPQQLSFAPKWGWEWMGGWGCIQKTIKKFHEINIISSLTSNKNSLKKAIKLGFFLLSSLTISLYCSQGLGMGGGGQPPYGGWFGVKIGAQLEGRKRALLNIL